MRQTGYLRVFPISEQVESWAPELVRYQFLKEGEYEPSKSIEQW
jgi:hypothetical protein